MLLGAVIIFIHINYVKLTLNYYGTFLNGREFFAWARILWVGAKIEKIPSPATDLDIKMTLFENLEELPICGLLRFHIALEKDLSL